MEHPAEQILSDDAVRARLAADLWDYGVPEHMHDAVLRYLMQGISPGSFLSAVISNDLMGALGKADDINRHALHAYGMFFYNAAPHGSHGSPEAMEAWIAKGGLGGET